MKSLPNSPIAAIIRIVVGACALADPTGGVFYCRRGCLWPVCDVLFDKKTVHKYNCSPLIEESKGGFPVYAIVKSGAKQYRVAVGDKIEVEKLPNATGDQVTLENVLMVEQDGTFKTGLPHVAGAQVIAKVVGEGKGKKVIHFDYRNKHRRRKTLGHRQQFTRLEISEIKL
jgi:large subunit ribosomal protein L21